MKDTGVQVRVQTKRAQFSLTLQESVEIKVATKAPVTGSDALIYLIHLSPADTAGQERTCF